MGCWTHRNVWLLLIVGLQIGLLTALAPDPTCNPSTEFSCRNDSSICIPLSRVKDGTPDCPDKSDEECNEQEFQCQSIHQCIPKERYHDGWPDCDDGSDEECGRGQFRCRCGIPHCIAGSKLKDGVKDCEDGSDEVSAKSRNKTARCPDESRLQDLLAMEKKRKKRQIHAFDGSLEDEGSRKFDESILDLQPSITDSYSNNFQYSYTKFLNERFSRDWHDPHRMEEAISKTDTSELKQKILSTKPFMIRTETDLYGSLNSGKIYQTAVNEPISVMPSAESTVLQFDDEKADRKFDSKVYTAKIKKYTEQEPRRFSDLMLKIAVLFQNDSETYDSPKIDKIEDQYLKNKSKGDKGIRNRKLLSISSDHHELPPKHVFKRSLKNSETDISHLPLVHSPTVPYMPQSNIHTTGIVMSTTGTDIIDDRTTEWTTIIEGTFIRGTYAHIVHSTSRIYYTIDTPAVTIETMSPVESLIPSNTDGTAIDRSAKQIYNGIEVTTVQTSSRSQRRNDKSLRLLDENEETSKTSADFELSVTNAFTSRSSYESRIESSILESSSFGSIMKESLLTAEADFILPTIVKEKPKLEITESIQAISIRQAESSLSSPTPSTVSIPDIISIEEIKNIDLGEENVEKSMNEPGTLNVVGRMVGNQSSELINSTFVENSTSETFLYEKSRKEGIIPTPTSFIVNFDDSSSSFLSEEIIKESNLKISSNTEFSVKASESEILPLTEISTTDDFLVPFITVSNNENSPRMATSLSIPDVRDLFAAFMPPSLEISHTEIVSNSSVESISESIQSVTILPTDSSSFTEALEIKEESLSSVASSSSSTNITESIFLSESSILITDSSVTNKLIQGDTMTMELPVPDSSYDSSSSSSEVMVFLGIASTINMENMPSSLTTSRTPFSIEKEEVSEATNSKDEDLNADSNDNKKSMTHETSLNSENSRKDLSEESDITVLLLPSMNLDDLKNIMGSSLASKIFLSGNDASEEDRGQVESMKITPALKDAFLTDNLSTDVSDSEKIATIITSTSGLLGSIEEAGGRAKRAVSESVTILRPEGRIVSTDARAYLTPTTLYTTYTYFTTILIPGGGTQIRSSLHVDSVIVEPTDRAVYGYGDHDQPCNECRTYYTELHDGHIRGSQDPDAYHVETVPYNADRASEITHRTTYTYYTTRFRGGTSFVETRKETKTDVTAIPSVRYSPFEIGTYYDGDNPDDYHYHTEAPHIHASVPSYYRPGHIVTQPVRNLQPTYSQRIDPNLYKPDRVTHRTTYTYHTTRFRDGVPIVNTRKETETNVTPIPTYSRPVYRQTAHRVTPTRPATYHPAIRETYYPNVHRGSNPYATHRTTYTYFTTRLIGGSTHVDTRYVTETNLTPNPTVPHVRGTTYYDDGYHGTECTVCREAQRTTVVRQPARTRVRGGGNTVAVRPSRRSEVGAEIQPSTATLYSTYTYATTQLTRGGIPVVRTREHTVTEVLSDVVLPTLKFGDRIRSKRTVKPEDDVPKNTVSIPKDTIHVVPVRHTFSRTVSYADGRQGRRIPVNEQNRSHRRNSQHLRTPFLNKDEVRNKENANSHLHRSQNANKNEEFEIKPTSITYFSTYTYFTTELEDGKPVVKSREHTVTEILTDVVVPTVSTLRKPHGLLATRMHVNSFSRQARDLPDAFSGNGAPLRKLLSASENIDNATKHDTISALQPSISISSYKTDFKTEILSSSTYNHQNNTSKIFSLEFTSSKVPSRSNSTKFFDLSSSEIPDNVKDYKIPPEINFDLKVIDSNDDLYPAGAEVRRAIVATPVTHYTTYTYYATKLKPGGERIIETNTKVASSITYPQPTFVYDQVESTKRNKLRTRHPQHIYIQSSPASYAERRTYQTDLIYGLGSQAVHKSSHPFRRQQLQRTCPNCNSRFTEQHKPYVNSGFNDRISRVQKDRYLTRVPVRNSNNARRISNRGSNEVYYPESNVKPTHVTYYSTYTYFTTEPLDDGSSVVKTREHTVTEILTNVIVPTVASFNRAHATAYNQNNYRLKRDTSENNIMVSKDFEPSEFVNLVHQRRLLSLEEDILTTESYSIENSSLDNLTLTGGNENSFLPPTDKHRNETFKFDEERIENDKNFTLLEENVPNLDISFQSSEILNNDTSRFFEMNEKLIGNISEPLLKANISELKDKIGEILSDNADYIPNVNKLNDTFLPSIVSAKESKSELNLSDTTDNLENSSREIKLFATSSINVPDLKTEDISLFSENTLTSFDTKNFASDVLRSSFLYSTNFLSVTESLVSPLQTETLVRSLEMSSIEKLDITNSDKLSSPFIATSADIEELFHSEDLTAEGAEVRHAIAATPTTHFTTYTYYSTIIKPGGKSEIITNTKVSASTYYPDVTNSYNNYRRSDRRYEQNRDHNYSNRRNYPQVTKVHDLQPARAVARTQYAYQPSRAYHSYKPSFATKVRGANYETASHNRCKTCNEGYINKDNDYRHNKHTYNRNNYRNYLTSVPVRRMPTQHSRFSNTGSYKSTVIKPSYAAANLHAHRVTPHHRRVSNQNTIPYDLPEIKPTRVTYYSTYTYFTTELQNGSPVVRSREHTVTEILTDVIVPTVTSFSRSRETKYPNLRGKRYVSSEEDSDNIALPFQRKLLSVEETENSDDHAVTEETDSLEVSLTSSIFDTEVNEDITLQNDLVASLNYKDISPTLQKPVSSATEVNDEFLNNAQFSKAFAAYLAFLESSGAQTDNVTKEENSNSETENSELNSLTLAENLVEAESNLSSYKPTSMTKSMMSIVTSDVIKNGRMTKYTTTIYGTYINGVYAQRAKSTSDVIPITEMDMSPVTTLMFSPSRLQGLVRSIVSRKMRGPIAVHLTTEIHGTFVGGAYAQTARVFTSSQPLSSTRESSRYRIPTYSTILSTGTRKTGLLSTRVLRSKVDGSTTLLFVSEIHGTHIGGAYAHLGTYTTRTIIHTPTSTFVEPEITSSTLSTYYMEDLTTGLITASVSEKDLNGITTRYHYQVYGTYLDGTYAHVPSISTETLTPRSAGSISTLLYSSTSPLESTSALQFTDSAKSSLSIASKSFDIIASKIGLIHASTRAHVTNGTTTQHIFEVHGTYLNGNYAHVPSVSIVTIKPSKTTLNYEDYSTSSTMISFLSESVPEPDFEILTIFDNANVGDKISATLSHGNKIHFSSDIDGRDDPEEYSEKHDIFDNDMSDIGDSSSILVSVSNNSGNEVSERSIISSQIFPILLPESLRLSLSHEYSKSRFKRSDPFSPYLRSSFTESIKCQKEVQHSSLVLTTPLPSSVFEELPIEFLTNGSKFHPSSKQPKTSFQTKMKNNADGKNISAKPNQNSKSKLFFLKRSKRSPAAIRSSFGASKRFGVSPSTSSARKFRSSSSFKRDSSTSSSRGFRLNTSSRNSITTTKPSLKTQTPSKSAPNFLARTQRSKLNLAHKSSTSTIKPTPSSSINILSTNRLRKFGKKESEKMDEDFEASEDAPKSVTEAKIKPTATSTSRFRRPSKLPKLGGYSSSSLSSSRSNKKIMPTSSRRSRLQTKNMSSRNRKIDYKDDDYDTRATETVASTSTKRRFTLTTTFEINLKPSAGYLYDTDDGNNLQQDNINNKRKNKNKNSSSRNRQGSLYKPIFDNDDNEVRTDTPKSLPLPVFGRSRGLKRPPKFDPRTIKASATSTSSVIYLTPTTSITTNETEDMTPESDLVGPVTVTDVFTTVKTLPVHLGLRTSFATITTTAYTTSTIQPEDLKFLTIGGITKTLLSAITGFPDANLPKDKQFTVITEVLLTTTEIESTSLVAIKVGFGTRTDTIIAKQKMTTLLTQTNTILEEKTASVPFQQQYPFFPNPFAPPLPPRPSDFSLSLAENSFVSTQTVTSTTILPIYLNGKTILTTLTSTSLSEETLVKTTTFKVPQQPTMQPFIFPQPVFILPSITTELTVRFTAHNGEIYSIVTKITVPLALNGHTRFARSVTESSIHPSAVHSYISHESMTHTVDALSPSVNIHKNEEPFAGMALQSSFSSKLKGPLSNEFTESLVVTEHLESTATKHETFKLENTNSVKHNKIKTRSHNFDTIKEMSNVNEVGYESYKVRKLLQFDDDDLKALGDKEDGEYVLIGEPFFNPGTQGSVPRFVDDFTYVPDTFHLIGPGFNEEGIGRPIPSVRVVPTRRAYVRRLKPSGSQNLPLDGNEDEFNFRRNNQNFPANINVPSGTEFNPVRPGLFPDDNIGSRRNVPISNGPLNNFGNLRNVQYFSPNRPNFPVDIENEGFSPARIQPNFGSNRPNRLQEASPNLGRNPATLPSIRNNNRPSQVDGFDALRKLPSYTPTRQNVPQSPPREESTFNANDFEEESTRNQVNRRQPAVTASPRRVIRLRRPGAQTRPDYGRELLDRKPIVNTLPDEKESTIRARGPVILTNNAVVRDTKDPENNENDDDGAEEYTNPLPLTYYTTFTYMTTFLNGPSTAYSTREAVVSNIATETVNPRLVGLIRSKGGFNTPNGGQTAVPLGSRAQGATTTIVNLASRVQLYNSDVYYGRHKMPGSMEEEDIKPTDTNLRTVPITDIASLPKTYYTLFTYFYTLKDGDKSINSQRSETISNIDTQTEPFIKQDFASTIDGSGFLTLKPNKQLVNLGLRTAGGTTTEVNLELKTVIHFDGLKNAVIDRGSITPTLVEVVPSETNSLYNNYLDPDDAEVQDQQTYPQTVPIQPSFSSANEVYVGTQRSSNREATPEIPSNSRIIRTQSIRGPHRIASTVLQRPGTLRSGVFAPRPGVRVRVRPVSSRVVPLDSSSSSDLDLTSYKINFDPSRTVSDDASEFDEDDIDNTEEDDNTEEYTTEETKSTEAEENQRGTSPGRKRLKITIRRSPGVSASRTNSAFIRPTRTRPRFYVVTRTASSSGGLSRQPKRPISVKVSRRLRPSGEPEYETYTTMTSVPVVFGLSTTYRNTIVTSSSLIPSDVPPEPEPSKTVVLTYFTTTTYTVPYTVDGIATFTTLEETNSRIATETLDPDVDLSFISTTTLDYGDDISASSSDLARQPPQTLKPQLVNNQLNVGPRVNLATKISNGVTLIVASDGEAEATHVVSQPTLTLRPTVVTDALYMTNKDITTFYEPRTFYTTFTFFTTFFSGGTPSISTSEQVITNVYSVPVTQSITRTQPANEPVTVIETSENLVSKTLYTTHTFYATLFNGTSTVVTPIEELHSSVVSSTETYTITKTIMPYPEILPTETVKPALTTTTSVYRTRTNYVTLFRGSESIVSPLEEIETDIVTLTLDSPKESYTTRTVQATNTHYITLFSGSESILSSITEVAPSVITEIVKQLQGPTTTPFSDLVSIRPTAVISSSSSSVEPIFQDLVPSIRTQYTTLTYFTTLFTDSSTILSSREEIATSYITLFVPAPAPGTTKSVNPVMYTSQAEQITPSKSSDIKESSVTPTSEILTFYTTYTYYTTLFKGNEAIISDSETVVTQYVTIESTPTDSVSRHTTSLPPTFSRPNYSDTLEIRTEPSTSSVTSPAFEKGSSSDKKASEDLKIIGVSTKVESDGETPSILTGIPSTDANGATHILFTDFIVPSSIDDSSAFSTDLYSEYFTPSLPDLASSVHVVSSVSFDETTFFPHESSTLSSARETQSDLATTRLTDVNVATHHMILHPTTTYQSGSSQTVGIKPGAVIDLSDVLTNTNLVGNLGETIKDIVNLFAAKERAPKNSTSKSSQSSSDTSIVLPSGGITISSADDPVFIPIGAIARSTKISSSPAEGNTEVPLLKPSTMLSGFTPIRTDDGKFTFDANNRKIDSVSSFDLVSDATLTSIVFGSNTIFIQPTSVVKDSATTLFSDMDGRFHSSFNTKVLHGSESNNGGNKQQATPTLKYSESTSLISGLETIFFGFPDARQPPQATTQVIQGSGSTSSIVGYETIFFDSPKDFYVPGRNQQVNITGATTIFGTFPILTETSTSSGQTPQSTFMSTSSGETTIFFPVPGDNYQQNPGTRYVTSVESVTLTLTLTTSSVYNTEDTPVTVTSVFTTTIPPRTFVSTIIGDRTILGTQPEPTEAVQVVPTIQPSESTTTVTTTTLIFNSIATTVVRTLVIPTNGIQPTKPSGADATDTLKLGGIAVQPNDRSRTTTERTRKPIQLFKSGNRPIDPTTPKPQRTGPPLKLFPTKPPTTTPKPTRPTTTRKNTFRKPGKTLVPTTDGCPRECNLKNKEVCKQSLDKSWSCQCRPGFFKKNGSEECKDVKSFVVLLRVLKVGDNEVTYSPDFSNHLSPEYKNLTTTARKAVDDAYKTSSVGDDFVSTNVVSIAKDNSFKPEGVLLNLTVQLSGEKPANEEFLKEELAHSLEAASSEISLSNASVSPIIQRVEDVQDFDECYDDSYNDCSKSAVCVNLPGTYTCECKEGYQDLEPTLPGRICSGEIKDCDYCNNRGVCIMTENDEKFCRCYRMYLGKQCEINGLVLAIALPIALALLILTMFCLLCGCRKLRQRRAQKPKPNVFKGMVPPMAGTLDRKAMIMDSSSESSGEHRPPAHAYDGFGDEVANSTMKRSRRSESIDDHMSEFQVPTVLIPRAKHSHPKQMVFGRDGEGMVGRDICTSYTTLPGRRMSTQSLVCEAPSLYPSVPRRQGSLCPLDKIAYESCIAQLNELRDARLPPPACHVSRRRRSSVASSQAALAGSGLAYMGSSGSRCHSALGHYGLEPELWLARRMSMTQSELLNEVNLSPSSFNPRQRWSEAGRSFGETTIRASLRQFRTNSDFLVPGSRQPSSRQITSEEQSVTEDLMDMSFTDSLMESNVQNYEKLPRRDRKRRNSKAYHCYDNPSSLQEYKGS